MGNPEWHQRQSEIIAVQWKTRWFLSSHLSNDGQPRRVWPAPYVFDFKSIIPIKCQFVNVSQALFFAYCSLWRTISSKNLLFKFIGMDIVSDWCDHRHSQCNWISMVWRACCIRSNNNYWLINLYRPLANTILALSATTHSVICVCHQTCNAYHTRVHNTINVRKQCTNYACNKFEYKNLAYFVCMFGVHFSDCVGTS